MIRLEIPDIPPSTNAHRTGWRNEHLEKSSFSGIVASVALDAGVYGAGLGSKDKPLRMEVVFVFGPRRRKSDVDNRLKGLQDALQSCGVITDDTRIHVHEAAKAKGPEDRTLVKLFEIPPLPDGWVDAWWAASDSQMELYLDAR